MLLAAAALIKDAAADELRRSTAPRSTGPLYRASAGEQLDAAPVVIENRGSRHASMR